MSQFCRKTLFATAALGLLLVGFSDLARADIETQIFDSEASAATGGWVGVENHNPTTMTDFGFSNTSNATGISGAGEAGGYFPRSKLPTGYYADTTLGTLDLTSPLSASGRVVFYTENLDGGLRLGWFNKDQLANALPSGVGVQFAEGNRFQANVRFNNETGTSSSLVSGGIGPTSAPFQFDWNPTSRIFTATIGGVTASTPVLTEAQWTLGSTLNSFGLYTGAAGSDIPTSRGRLYIDDLTYTSADIAAIDPPTPQLRINRFTGATRIFGSGGTDPLQFDKYTAGSNAANPPLENVWLPGSWNSVTDQTGGGWSEVTGTAQTLSEQNPSGSKTLNPNSAISLGNVYDKATGAADVTFSYSLANENFDRSGQVVFDGGFTLKVNKSNGNVSIVNNEPVNIALDGYVMQSASGVLAGAWNSLQDKALTGWEEIATSNSNNLSEVNLSNSSLVTANGGVLELGAAYSGGLAGLEDLKFTFSVGGGTIVAPGSVEYVGVTLAGDYNSDTKVDAADYTIWRDTLNSTTDLRADGNGNLVIDTGDYQTWKTNFGQHSGSGADGGLASVPEPATWLIAMLGLAFVGGRRNPK
jgi:hypothetical protein